MLGLAGRDDVDRFEVVLDVDAQIRPLFAFVFGGNLLRTLRKIADVPDTGFNAEAGAEVFVDRLGLGRRFDDDQRLPGGLGTGRFLFCHLICCPRYCRCSAVPKVLKDSRLIDRSRRGVA